MTDRVGQQFGNYRLLHLIGQGSLTEVYLGEHLHLGTKAAVKVHYSPLASDDLELFRSEARIAAALAHLNIVRILDFGVEEGIPFLVMEYAPNGTMRQRIPEGMQLLPESVVPYVSQVASALQYVHDQRLIHRNVKPENMLLGQNDEVLLDDFCFSVVFQSSSVLSIQKPVGTISYMAPEQLQGKPRPASDQYALGIVVYEWLSGHRPFQGSPGDIAKQHILVPPAPLRERIPSISPEVEQVVLKALEKDSHRRFASIQEFAAAFAQACQPHQSLYAASTFIPERPDTETQLFSPLSLPISTSSTQPRRRFPRRTFIVGLAGLAVAGSGLAWFVRSRGSGNVPIFIPANLNIYTITAQDPLTHHSFVYALRARDGFQRWHYATDGTIASLSESAGIVYIETFSLPAGTSNTSTPLSGIPSTTYLYSAMALRATDGEPLWRFQPQNTQLSLFVGDKGVVYIASAEPSGQITVSALRASDGAILWKYPMKGNEQTTLGSLVEANGVVYLSTTETSSTQPIIQRGAVYALRASDRTLLWQYTIDQASAGIRVVNGVVEVFSAEFSGTNLVGISLASLRASDGKLLWQFKTGIISAYWETSDTFYVAHYDSLQSQSGTVSALRHSDGSLLWHYQTDRVPVRINVNNGVLYVAAQQIYFTSQQQSSEFFLYALRATEGKLIWQTQIKGLMQAPFFTLSDQALFVNTSNEPTFTDTLYALGVSDGSILWNLQKPQEEISWFVPDGDVIYFGTRELSKSKGFVCAYQAGNGTPIWRHQIEAASGQFVVA